MVKASKLLTDNSDVTQAIDSIIERVRHFAVEPQFSQEVTRRTRQPNFDLSDRQVLKRMIELIAFSEGAQSKLVADVLARGELDSAFGDYDVEKVSQLRGKQLKEKYWQRLTPLRFPKKLEKMVGCARAMQQIASTHGSFMKHLESKGLPTQITSPDEMEQFWDGFDRLRADLQSVGIPSFQNLTTLCHLLSDFGFDCAKPDSVVMGVATQVGIVPDRKTHSESERRDTIRRMQGYSTLRGLRTPVVDLYFLIAGKQTEATKFVKSAFYASR